MRFNFLKLLSFFPEAVRDNVALLASRTSDHSDVIIFGIIFFLFLVC